MIARPLTWGEAISGIKRYLSSAIRNVSHGSGGGVDGVESRFFSFYSGPWRLRAHSNLTLFSEKPMKFPGEANIMAP
jgi:hypothetical protein